LLPTREVAVEDVMIVVARIMQAVAEDDRDIAFCASSLCAFMLFRGPAPLEGELKLVEEFTLWLSSRTENGSVH
tara:strand:+ start:818 stop:1039 length:222 start_codon:yes stop_codon:yes gene_type:complete